MGNKIGLHGDVMLTPCEIPELADKQVVEGDLILAEGEATGHAHRIKCDGQEAELYEREGTLYLKVNQTVQLTHEEHKTVDVLPGSYKVGQQRQFDYSKQSERSVVD